MLVDVRDVSETELIRLVDMLMYKEEEKAVF